MSVRQIDDPTGDRKDTDKFTSSKLQKYQDYMEELSLKIRYLKNDVEFKTDQNSKQKILEKGISKNKGKKVAMHQNNSNILPRSLVYKKVSVSNSSGGKRKESSKIVNQDDSCSVSPKTVASSFVKNMHIQSTKTNSLSISNNFPSSKLITCNKSDLKNISQGSVPSRQITNRTSNHFVCEPKLSSREVHHNTPPFSKLDYKRINFSSINKRYMIFPLGSTKVNQQIHTCPTNGINQNNIKYQTEPHNYYNHPTLQRRKSFSKNPNLAAAKSPFLKLQIANRIISKYKLKKNSPTTTTKYQSPFFRNVTPKSQFKLDKRFNFHKAISRQTCNARSRSTLSKSPIKHFFRSKSRTFKVDNRILSKTIARKDMTSKSSPVNKSFYSPKSKRFKQHKQKAWFSQSFPANIVRLSQKNTTLRVSKFRWHQRQDCKSTDSNKKACGQHALKEHDLKLRQLRYRVALKLNKLKTNSKLADQKENADAPLHSSGKTRFIKHTRYVNNSTPHVNTKVILKRESHPLNEKLSQQSTVGRMYEISSRLRASQAIQRSKAIAVAKYRKINKDKSKRHCIFYGRFGKCARGKDCPFIHDPIKVTVCTKFLRGKCCTKNCPFSHEASENKMPVCLFYLRSSCVRENCPYIHVKVNPDAPVCKDFLQGYCSKGKECVKFHSFVCPSFASNGRCSRGDTCTMLHRVSKTRRRVSSTNSRQSIGFNFLKNPSDENDDTKMEESTVLVNTQETMGPLQPQPSFISLIETEKDNEVNYLQNSKHQTIPSFLLGNKNFKGRNVADVSHISDKAFLEKPSTNGSDDKHETSTFNLNINVNSTIQKESVNKISFSEASSVNEVTFEKILVQDEFDKKSKILSGGILPNFMFKPSA